MTVLSGRPNDKTEAFPVRSIRPSASLFVALLSFAGAAAAQPQSERFVCTGTFSSGSGMAGSSLDRDGKATCYFEADTQVEVQAQKMCGQNKACEVVAMTRLDAGKRIVEKVLSINGHAAPASAPSSEKRDASAAGGIRAEASACPAETFDAFAEKFSSSISVQAKFTHWPLKHTTIDAAARPEPKPVTKEVTEREISYPLMMALDRAKREGKVVRVAQDGKSEGSIEYAGSNSGEKTRYLFTRSESCWQLVAIDDKSL
jgi:hypothetical protein